MKQIYSKVNPDQLLHIVYRQLDFRQRQDLVEGDNFLQVATLKFNQGKFFKPHYHLFKAVDFEQYIAQESWVVIKGEVRVDFYDIDESLITSEFLSQGDASITLFGGHGYTILKEDTLVYEYKTGPYQGQLIDKKFIGDH